MNSSVRTSTTGGSLNHYLALAREYGRIRTGDESSGDVSCSSSSSTFSTSRSVSGGRKRSSPPPVKIPASSKHQPIPLPKPLINPAPAAPVNDIFPPPSLHGALLSLRKPTRLLAPSLFPFKLHCILSSSRYSHIIGWSPDGRSWNVRDTDGFMSEVAPLHFKMKKFASFVRMVYLWGFIKRKNGVGFYNENFQQGKPLLCEHMVLRKNRSKGPSQTRSGEGTRGTHRTPSPTQITVEVNPGVEDLALVHSRGGMASVLNGTLAMGGLETGVQLPVTAPAPPPSLAPGYHPTLGGVAPQTQLNVPTNVLRSSCPQAESRHPSSVQQICASFVPTSVQPSACPQTESRHASTIQQLCDSYVPTPVLPSACPQTESQNVSTVQQVCASYVPTPILSPTIPQIEIRHASAVQQPYVPTPVPTPACPQIESRHASAVQQLCASYFSALLTHGGNSVGGGSVMHAGLGMFPQVGQVDMTSLRQRCPPTE